MAFVFLWNSLYYLSECDKVVIFPEECLEQKLAVYFIFFWPYYPTEKSKINKPVGISENRDEDLR